MDIQLSEKNEKRITSLVNELVSRGAQINEHTIINEILDNTPEEYWKSRLEELTPLIWKFNQALQDPSKEKALRLLLEKSISAKKVKPAKKTSPKAPKEKASAGKAIVNNAQENNMEA